MDVQHGLLQLVFAGHAAGAASALVFGGRAGRWLAGGSAFVASLGSVALGVVSLNRSVLSSSAAGFLPLTGAALRIDGLSAFFLIVMPVLGLIETPRRLPNSITEAVLDKNRGSASAQPATAAAAPQSKG